MSQPNASYVDGYVTPERQVTVIPDIEYPFENYSAPDTYARLLDRRYDVTPKFFQPKIGVRTSWTNYLLYNATYANVAWTKTNITNTDNSYANPGDGTATMALGLETVTNAEHAYQQAYTFTATAHTLSWIVYPNGRTWYRLKANDGTTNFTAFFNLTGAGVVGTTANCTATVSLVGYGMYRLAITFTPLAAAGNVYLNFATDGATVSYAGNVTLGAYVWAAQIVRASTAGPVIITTSVAIAVSAPNLDPDDIFAYMVQEQAPRNYNSAVASVARKFGRIPAPQISYPGSRYIPLPGVNSLGTSVESVAVDWQYNNSIGPAFYLTESNYLFLETQNSFYGTMKLQTARVIGVASAGTFTLTFGANTTAALAWNASNATIKAAIDGLASVTAAGLTSTVLNFLSTGTGGQLQVTWSGNTSTALTMNAGSLTVTTSANVTTTFNSSAIQIIYLPDHYTITAHGFNTALDLAVRGIQDNNVYYFPTGKWGSIDANTVWISNLTSTNYGVLFGTFVRSYFPGQTFLVRTRVTETFYLPGVTVGITTPADIASPIGLQNPADFIDAILTASGFELYQSEGPQPWMGTLIYVVKSVDINVSDFT